MSVKNIREARHRQKSPSRYATPVAPDPTIAKPKTSEKRVTEKTRKSHSVEALANLSATIPFDKRAHLARTGKQVLHAWRNNKFCDVVVKADHSLFYAHLEVFAAFTDYFEELPEKRKLLQINLGDVRPDDCATVLKYLYFGELHADAENIFGVWIIAKALKVRQRKASNRILMTVVAMASRSNIAVTLRFLIGSKQNN